MNGSPIFFVGELEERLILNSKFEIITNVNANPTTKSEDFKKLLVEQIYSKVRWRESLNYIHTHQVDTFIEIGPGKVLSGMVKRTLKNVKSFSINNIEDIKTLTNV